MDKKLVLEQIEKNVKVCKKCRLYKFAKNPVPGEGNPNAQLVFVGEAPGATEDATGKPFVGRAGKLLEALLKEIGMQRSDVWIGNVIKHRPPQNRAPLEDEIVACAPCLTLQLKAISPKLIVTLGRFAMTYFYKEGKITRDHGHVIKTPDYTVFPVYHPAAALRNPVFAKALREDFNKIPRILKELSTQSAQRAPSSETEDTSGQVGLGL